MNAEDSEGNTPLHVKCYGETNEQSEIECIQILLERNVSLTIRNSRVRTIIFLCLSMLMFKIFPIKQYNLIFMGFSIMRFSI